MEKFDILVIAVLVFGAFTFFALSRVYKIFVAICNIYEILNNHKDALNSITRLMETFDDFAKKQSTFNECVKDNLDKISQGNSPTGGRRSEAEAL